MTFISTAYFIFFIIVSLLLGITNIDFIKTICNRYLNLIRHSILLLASYIFYGWWNWRFCFLLLFVTSVAYVAGLFPNKRIIMKMAVAFELGVLCIFKYYNFFVGSFCELS